MNGFDFSTIAIFRNLQALCLFSLRFMQSECAFGAKPLAITQQKVEQLSANERFNPNLN